MNQELENKYSDLKSILSGMGKIVIGFSGGADSALLLKVAVDSLGDRAVAVIGRSETYPAHEYEEAVKLVKLIGARCREVKTEETDDVKFRENPVDRCYYCKSELFSKLQEVAAEEKIEWIADGSILDDLADFRPGRKASAEKNVRSPLVEAGFRKQEVRLLSRHLGLPTWDKPSFACLSSRFPYGFGITREGLQKIEGAEMFLRTAGFRGFRVRHHDEKTARIELSPDEIQRMLQPEIRNSVIEKFKSLGFTYVTLDLQGYRTGSMNEVLPPDIMK